MATYRSARGNWVKLSGDPADAINMDHVISVKFDKGRVHLSFVVPIHVSDQSGPLHSLPLSAPADVGAIKAWLDEAAPSHEAPARKRSAGVNRATPAGQA